MGRSEGSCKATDVSPAPLSSAFKDEAERAEKRVAAPSPGGEIYSPQTSDFIEPYPFDSRHQ